MDVKSTARQSMATNGRTTFFLAKAAKRTITMAEKMAIPAMEKSPPNIESAKAACISVKLKLIVSAPNLDLSQGS